MLVYADNAATTRLSAAAKAAMLPFFDEVYGNPSSLHTPGQLAKEGLEQARLDIAALLNAPEGSQLIFTSGGSEADNQAIRSAAALGARKGKRHIISSKFEHHAVLHTLRKLEKEGFEVTYLDVYREGLVRPADLEAAIREDTALVTIMFANNEIGTVQPVAELGAICRKHGVLFHTDAVQAVGHIPVDVETQNIDLLSLSGHKFGGPKGAGVLYARKGIRLENLMEGGAQERMRRPGTENMPAIAGMAAALKEAVAGMEETNARLTALRDKLIDGLSAIPHACLNGDRERRLPGTVNFCFEGIEGESLLLLLDARGIAASSGSACTSGSLDPSHVLLALGLPHEVAHGSLRLSFGPETTEEEIDYILTHVPQVVDYLRNISPVWEALEKGEKIMLYSEKVMDHFQHPRNLGKMEDADGIGEVGNAKCGDIMKIYIKVEDGVISDVKFNTFGCGSAIATSSMATEMIKGKPIEEALQLSNRAVVEALDGLPPAKIHCSVLAEEAVRAAVKDYYDKNGIAYDAKEFCSGDCCHCHGYEE